jgi:hypothetical protein
LTHQTIKVNLEVNDMNNKKQIIGLLFQNSRLDEYKEKYEYYFIKNQGEICYEREDHF